MAKALQERLHIRANQEGLIYNAVRYGNVLESRGSLIPILKSRFENELPVYITHKDMTRFFMALDDSVGLIKTALMDDDGGKIFVPVIRSAKIIDVMELLCEKYGKDINSIKPSKIRPGEKIDEVLIALEETRRTKKVDNVFVIHDVLSDEEFDDISEEFSSRGPSVLLNREELRGFLMSKGIL
jgi:UDP-glucose 4-epimerase